MSRHSHSEETVGIRYTGWAALDRDPQLDEVEFVCPHCGQRGKKSASKARADYHFSDGFVQDVEGETTKCRGCRRSLHVAPVVLLHDQDETRRFQSVFSSDMGPAAN
jgi:hypothetical protein